MKIQNTFQLLLLGSCLALGFGGINAAVAQQTPNPLDRFRNDNNGGQEQAQQVQRLNATPPTIPAPTVGGFQQPGLSQEEMNQALESYNFGDLAAMEEQQAEAERIARESAFEATINGALPLRPEEIRELLDRYRDVREASESRIGGSPTPEIAFETISLDPSALPPVIKLSPGHVTTLNIVDITGKPWPVRDISWGGNFEVIQPQQGEHVIRISPMKAHEVGNLSMQLLDLDTPVTFTLRTQLDEVQYRFDAQISEYGPNAEIPAMETPLTINAGNSDIVKILDGAPPSGAEKLDVSGVDGRTTAYDYGGQIYVRTPLTLLSPGWQNSVTSADGTKVYVINPSPVLLLSDKGKMARATID